MGGKFYAVRVGRRPGVYRDWNDVKPLVDGFPGAQHKSFKTRDEAERYLEAASTHAAGSKRRIDEYESEDHSDGDDGREFDRRQSCRRSSPLSRAPPGGSNAHRSNDNHRSSHARAPSPRRAPAPAPVQATIGVIFAERPWVSSASGYDLSGGRGGNMGGNGSARGGGRSPFEAVVEGPFQAIRPGTQYDLEFDGASRGNPGRAGCGAVLRRSDSKTVIFRLRKYMGTNFTNNEAEYTALLEGMKTAHRLGATCINAVGDSQLVVRQVEGTYDARKDHLRVLRDQVRAEAQRLDSFSISHIPREHNTEADKLSNDAIDLAYR